MCQWWGSGVETGTQMTKSPMSISSFSSGPKSDKIALFNSARVGQVNQWESSVVKNREGATKGVGGVNPLIPASLYGRFLNLR